MLLSAMCLTPSLQALSIDAPKRKGGGSELILRRDSAQNSVRSILLSRILVSRDEKFLINAASTAVGRELIKQLSATVLSIARCIGGEAASQLTDTNMSTLLNLTGSSLTRSAAYNTQMSLPARLPHPAAVRLYDALLDAVGPVSADRIR